MGSRIHVASTHVNIIEADTRRTGPLIAQTSINRGSSAWFAGLLAHKFISVPVAPSQSAQLIRARPSGHWPPWHRHGGAARTWYSPISEPWFCIGLRATRRAEIQLDLQRKRGIGVPEAGSGIYQKMHRRAAMAGGTEAERT